MKMLVSEIFEFVRNGFNAKHEINGGGVPITRIETISDATINLAKVGYAGISISEAEKYMLKDGDILFSHINSVSHIGKCAIYKKEFGNLVHGMNLLCFRPNAEKVDPNYALHLIRSSQFKDQLAKSIKKAVNQASVSTGDIKKIALEVPPLAEQKSIAALLDTVNNVSHLREQAITKLDELAQSVFVSRCKSSIFTEHTLDQVAEMYQPKTISSSQLTENGKYVVYGANGIIGRYDEFNHAESEVLVTCRGATCGTLNKSDPYAWITGNAMVVRPKINGLIKDFLYFYLRFIADFGSVITGAAQPQITRQSLSRLLIQVPDIAEQNALVKDVNEIFDRQKVMRNSLLKIDELQAALQYQSFAVN